MNKAKGRGRPKKNTLILSAPAPEPAQPMLVKAQSAHPGILPAHIFPVK